MLFIFAWGECKVEVSHHFFSLTIMLEIVTNTFLSISSSVFCMCLGSVYTLYCSVVGKTLQAISETIWWSSSPSQLCSLTKLSLLCESSVCCGKVCKQTFCLNWQHRLSLASGPSILLWLYRLTATTTSNVSALILPKSRLHLDYNSTDIKTLELFSI